MEFTLVRVTADGGQTPVRISKDRTMIGRDTSCQIRVPAVDVSRRHCEIVRSETELVVNDMGSRNGTLVNGERVEQASVAPGDVVTVGPLVFVVQADGEPSEIDAAGAHRLGSAGSKSPKKKASAAAEKPVSPEHPTSLGGGGLMDDIAPGSDLDDSSVVEFDFDFDDEDDDQPPL